MNFFYNQYYYNKNMNTVEIVKSINILPDELATIIMNYYWVDIYKQSIEFLESSIYDLNKILNFIVKFIIRDYDRLYSNFHLHYYYYKYNDMLKKIIKDKGLFLFLKKYFNVHFSDPDTIDVYQKLDNKIRYIGIVSISLSNSQRYVIYHNFKKFNEV